MNLKNSVLLLDCNISLGCGSCCNLLPRLIATTFRSWEEVKNFHTLWALAHRTHFNEGVVGSPAFGGGGDRKKWGNSTVAIYGERLVLSEVEGSRTIK
jgi:hypothetical protein